MLVSERMSDIEKEGAINQAVVDDTPMKRWLVEYVGENSQNVSNGEVTVGMIVSLMAQEFPEFVMALAEENFIRGYRQAFIDIEAGQELVDSQSPEESNDHKE